MLSFFYYPKINYIFPQEIEDCRNKIFEKKRELEILRIGGSLVATSMILSSAETGCNIYKDVQNNCASNTKFFLALSPLVVFGGVTYLFLNKYSKTVYTIKKNKNIIFNYLENLNNQNNQNNNKVILDWRQNNYIEYSNICLFTRISSILLCLLSIYTISIKPADRLMPYLGSITLAIYNLFVKYEKTYMLDYMLKSF